MLRITEEQANRYYRAIKSGRTVEEICNYLGITKIELEGLVFLLNDCYGKKIDFVETEDHEFVVMKKPIKRVQRKLKLAKEDCIYNKYMVVSDTHLGNNRQQLHILNDLYLEAYEREIENVYHVGDLIDGDYSSHRKEHPRQVFLHGFDELGGYVVDMYPEVNGITTHFILGSHDETTYKNGQATIGYWIPRCRKDMIYLGQDQWVGEIGNVRAILDHPGDGSAYSLSYKPQKRIEEFESGHKPKVIYIGHYHKYQQGEYRNVKFVQVPAICDKTPFQIKKGISNHVGGVFIEQWSDEKGNIQYFKCEPRLYGPGDMWDENGKDAPKVKRLVIK